MTEALSVRKTNTYVGTWRHLDEWEDIGSIDVLATTTFDMDDDECGDSGEPRKTVMLVCVECDQPEPKQLIERALASTYSAWGCSHEYDCCGCRSYSAQAQHLAGNRYEVTIHSSRNY